MTKKAFFDTDCISSFMWVGETNIIEELFGPNIVIPEEVYSELSRPCVNWLKVNVDKLIEKGSAKVETIVVGSSEYIIYNHMTQFPDKKIKIIGSGEAAAVALAYAKNGILASNNLKDISYYVKKYNLEHITTTDILRMAIEEAIIVDIEAESIWRQMKYKGILLPAGSFMENKSI